MRGATDRGFEVTVVVLATPKISESLEQILSSVSTVSTVLLAN